MSDTTNLYWISLALSNYSSPLNWSFSSGGTGGDGVPDLNNTAIYDASGPGPCVLDATAQVGGLLFQSGFDGIFNQNTYPILVNGDASFLDGGFEGGDSSVQINGNCVIEGTQFLSTQGILDVRGSFKFLDSTGFVEEDEIIIEHITVDSTDEANKYIHISERPNDASNVALNIIGGVPQFYGQDYEMSDHLKLSWDGFAIDGTVSAGDTLRVVYAIGHDRQPGNFFHNQGTLRFNTGNNTFDGNGITMWNTELINDSTDFTGYFEIDSTGFVEEHLLLDTGYFKTGADSTLFVRGDIECRDTFGRLGEGRDTVLNVDGTRNQYLYYTFDGILPTLHVDKVVENPLYSYGDGPVVIDGDLKVLDGTFNTRGLDLLVGLYEHS